MPEPSTPAAAFRWSVRVYWEDTDAGGIVFYANFLKFFERARTEWLRALGLGQERLRHDTGTMFVVTETSVRYLRPARLDDLLAVTVDLELAGRAQMRIVQQAWRMRDAHDRHDSGDTPELLAEGTIRIGCVSTGTYRPTRIPNAVLAALAQPMPPTSESRPLAE